MKIPKPWHANHDPDVKIVRDENENHVAYVMDGNNMSLVVAAPEMMDFIFSMENDKGQMPPHVWEWRNKIVEKLK